MKVFHLPDLGEGLAEAEIREWYVKEGETVKVDQPLVSMETAKAVVDVPSPYEGKIIKLHGKANDIIKTGAAFVSFETEQGENADKGSVVGKLEASEKTWDDGEVIIGAAKPTATTIKAMPAARVLAKQMDIDLATVKASGPNGLITPDDIKRHMEHSAPSTHLPGQTETLHGVRRVMAQMMTQSHKEVVPVTLIDEIDITHLPSKSDFTVLLLQGLVAAAKAEPSLNAWFDGKNLERKLFSEINIGLAVDTPEGLFVPVIKHAETLSAIELREKIDSYKHAVRDRSIAPADMQGATLTLSNFGMISGRYATPIVVPPAVAILGCGRSRDTALVKDGKVAAGKVMPLSLTFDHRAVTGGEATRFLSTIIKFVENSH